jgi:small GTP-binding protein
MDKYDYFIKIVIIGESGVGKTSLMNVYLCDAFGENYISTIGIDFRVKTLNINNKMVRVQIWDTAGHEKFRAIIPSYFRGAHIILLVFDLTDRKSFEKIDQWITNIQKHLPEGNYRLLLVGNKCDEISKFQIKESEIDNLIDKHELKYVKVSAKTHMNVEKAFNMAISDAIESKIVEEEKYHKYHSNIYIIPESKSKINSTCCQH